MIVDGACDREECLACGSRHFEAVKWILLRSVVELVCSFGCCIGADVAALAKQEKSLQKSCCLLPAIPLDDLVGA